MRTPSSCSLCEISGFRRGVHENCALLGFYAACSGTSLPTVRYNLSVPSSRVKNSLILAPLKMRPTVCPEASLRYYNYTLRNSPEDRAFLAISLFVFS